MSWDNDEFDVPSGGKDAALMDDWDAADSDDEPLIDGDSWDVDEDELKKKKEEEEKKKKAAAEAAAKQKAAKDAKARKSVISAKMLDSADPNKRKELLRQAELEADLNNAADLFGSLGVAEEHPRAKALAAEQAAAEAVKNQELTIDTPITDLPIFQCESKQDFERLRKALIPVFQGLASQSLVNYSNTLTIDLTREIVKPMTSENIRKLISTLNVVVKDKERAERQARLAKSGGTATGGAGKKKGKGKVNLGGAFKKDDMTDNTNYDDFGDDDFM